MKTIRCYGDFFATRSNKLKDLAKGLESVTLILDEAGFVKGFFFTEANKEEAKILRDRMQRYCEERIDGFTYKWSYCAMPTTAANGADKPTKYTIELKTATGKETRTFTAPYEVWDVRNTTIPTVWEEIKFFAEILDFIEFDTSYIFGRKPTVISA